MNLAAGEAARLAALIDGCRRAVVFTGAGISTESGIPDFRSPGGLWTKNQPIDFREFQASAETRREAWRRKFTMDEVIVPAQPNRGHRAVEKLVRDGKVRAVVTQNVDGLHQASGIPEDRIVELHGNTTYAKCLDCAMRCELGPLRDYFERHGEVYDCESCGGIIKTATISFGQAMPEEEMRLAELESLACDLFIAVGTSLVVYPAAGFPVLAKRNGASLAILNREPTPLDGHADLVLNAEIGPTLGDAVNVN
jgi:NAD-dependent deacetylase